MSAASPLSILTLFRRGPRLRVLAIMSALNELCNGRPLRMICDTQKDEVLGWTPIERGRFNSWAGATTLPSFVGASRVISALGSHWVVALGLLVRCLLTRTSCRRPSTRGLCLCLQGYAAELMVSRSASRQLTFYWARLLGVGSFVANVALSSRLNMAGVDAGIPRGELQGAAALCAPTSGRVLTRVWVLQVRFRTWSVCAVSSAQWRGATSTSGCRGAAWATSSTRWGRLCLRRSCCSCR